MKKFRNKFSTICFHILSQIFLSVHNRKGGKIIVNMLWKVLFVIKITLLYYIHAFVKKKFWEKIVNGVKRVRSDFRRNFHANEALFKFMKNGEVECRENNTSVLKGYHSWLLPFKM